MKPVGLKQSSANGSKDSSVADSRRYSVGDLEAAGVLLVQDGNHGNDRPRPDEFVSEGVAFVRAAPPRVAATVTPQHLLLDRNALFEGGIRPHHYCLPVLKRRRHREALCEAVASGSPKFFLGTDSAPHERSTKLSACGCAGIFSAPVALPLYAEAFESIGALDRLEGFASRHGPAFYRLPVAEDTITLRRESWTVPQSYPFGEGTVVAMRADRPIAWRVVSTTE